MKDQDKIMEYQEKKGEWIDDVVTAHLNPISNAVLALLGQKMQNGKLTLGYRILFVVFGLLHKMEIIEHKNVNFIEKKTKMILESVRIEVKMNGKVIGEQVFTLNIINKK